MTTNWILPFEPSKVDPFVKASATAVWSVNQAELYCATWGVQVRLGLNRTMLRQGPAAVYPHPHYTKASPCTREGHSGTVCTTPKTAFVLCWEAHLQWMRKQDWSTRPP